MYCRYCGKLIPDDSQYCEFCGKQINVSLDEKSSANVKEEVVEKCRVCEKILYNNEPRILLETGEVMCEDCATALREERIKPEDIELEDEEKFESIPKDVLDVINNKEDYTEEFIDEEPAQIDVYQEKIDDETCEDSDFSVSKNESVILQKQFDCMDTDDLKEYLDIVVTMEKNIYLQNSLISQMRERYAQLGQAHIYNEPTAPKDSSGGGIVAAIMNGGLAFIGFLLARWGLQLIYGSDSLGSLLGVVVSFLGGIFLMLGVFMEIAMFGADARAKERYLEEKRSYDIAYAEYEENIRMDKERVRKEELEKKVLSLEILLLQEQNKNSRQNLEQIYSPNIIFPKYRNLVMLCSIYEYICAGRCTTLEGHEGAYNILEMEIRLDRIITQLDLVIARLDVIRNNQYMLYSAIQETNQQITQILKSTNYVMDSLQNFRGQAEELIAIINSVEKNSMLATYQAENMQKELHYMNRMNYLSGKYNNVFYNVPPS